MNWVFLSYELNSNLSGYGDGKRIEVNKVRSICCGDSSNNTELALPTHLGTHLDFPYHFSDEGKFGSAYQAKDFVFDKVKTITLNIWKRNDKLIGPSDFEMIEQDVEIEALILQTGYSEHRQTKEYWHNNPGCDPALAEKLKKIFPKLRLIGFDSISLTNYQNRELGRESHKKFLIDHNILILEDMNLSPLKTASNILQLIVSPLRFEQADGAPATVLARIK